MRYPSGIYFPEGGANYLGKEIQVAMYVLKKYTKRIESSRGEGEVGRGSWMQEDGQRLL